MITINGEKELIRVESWDDIQTRPGFDGQLNPTDHELDSIIGNYIFPDQIPCGLSTCHRPHGRGYLVATKDGRLTNIGKDCGKTYFGVDFEAMSRQFDRDITAKENRERLWSFSFKIDEIFSTISQIRKGANGYAGADWIHKTSRPLLTLNQGYPDLVVRRVLDLLRTGSDQVLVQREASKDEAERADALAGRRVPRPHYIEESVGRISNLESLRKENDLREILIIELESKLKNFSEINIDTLLPTQLNQWSKWIGTVDGQIEKAIHSVESGAALLTKRNLQPLSMILERAEDAAVFQRYLEKLPE
ncbi:hypothetical protein [Burkholderia glumae]|uniref:hypothetical protein n=1 Tax=Burkholderia glumae TaxID=337 RepID=UPI000C2766A7|nr:hypothetical protein [Burkholderia glumae]PJO24289.1 hypothetical protein Y5A_003915 [Burkholderia glumae AU6208]QHE11520.1 hypothetical protein GQR88_14565 [Burkholderia glumae AU6208]